MDLSDRNVLLTGATGGIGQAIARALHERGAHLVLTGRRTDVLEPLATETGGRAIAVDLSDPADLHRLVAEAGDVDVLVANAGLPAAGPLADFTEEQIDRAIDVNLRAPMVLARLLAEPMIARGSGHIVLVSSLAGKTGTGQTSVYNATKFGLRGFGQGLRADLHAHGIGVSTVFPGFIREAGMFAESGTRLPRGVGTSTPEDVAAGVLKAIERNRGEVDVAPAVMRAMTAFAAAAPGPAAAMARRMGADEIGDQMTAGQRDKR